MVDPKVIGAFLDLLVTTRGGGKTKRRVPRRISTEPWRSVLTYPLNQRFAEAVTLPSMPDCWDSTTLSTYLFPA